MNGQIALQTLLEALVNTVREPLVVLDRNLRVQTANRSFYQAFDVSPDEIQHLPLYELGNGQWNIPALRDLLHKVLLEDCHFEDFELEHNFPSLGRRVMLLNAQQVSQAENLPRCILLAIEDITARTDRDRVMRDRNAKLTRVNRELQDFAQAASQDLQEPLRKIQWYGELLSNAAGTALNDGCRGYLDRIRSAASRMQTLINDLLTLSCVETKAEACVATNLGVIAREVLADLETEVHQSRAAIHIHSDLPEINADPLQMRQLLQNLISYSLKYHKAEEPPVVTVRNKLVTGPLPDGGIGTLCHLIVEDNGIGFDERDLDGMFHTLQRPHAKSAYEGTGIGLAVCRKIAERHGGTITAKSKPGLGTTFIVTLPVNRRKTDNE